MFCEKCGSKFDIGDDFCIKCGEHIPKSEVQTPRPIPMSQQAVSNTSFPIVKYIVAVLAVAFLSYLAYVTLNDVSTDVASEETDVTNEYYSALDELGPYMEPVGYFSDMSQFESDIDVNDWYGLIEYNDIEETPVTEDNMTFASVVKIVCEDDEGVVYGSGTNVDRFGYILTNLHVVEGFAEDACMVGFPDPRTGLIREAYWTTIITDNANETEHDLAYLSVERPVFDGEGNVYGYYEKIVDGTLPYFENTEACLDRGTQLGDELRILGYPFLSGGSLTVTNGLVSSLFSPSGYIVTSAKINAGNSGGLAIDNSDCFIGVPTNVYYDEYDVSEEIFGEIIDAEFVAEFDRAIQDDLDVYYGLNEITDVLSADQDVPEMLDTSDAVIKTIVLEVPGALRGCASTDCEVIRYYAEGASVGLVGQTGDWYEIQARDDFGSTIEGYIHESIFEKPTVEEVSMSLDEFMDYNPTRIYIDPPTVSARAWEEFTVSIKLNSPIESVNASEGVIGFDAKNLLVTDVDYSNSLFNLWTQFPIYNNSTGNVVYGGGVDTPFIGSNETLFRVTFLRLNDSASAINFSNTYLLASDGLATEIDVQTVGATISN